MRGIIAALTCEGPAMNMTLKELGALERFVRAVLKLAL
jgi:hypothetical protein